MGVQTIRAQLDGDEAIGDLRDVVGVGRSDQHASVGAECSNLSITERELGSWVSQTSATETGDNDAAGSHRRTSRIDNGVDIKFSVHCDRAGVSICLKGMA